ncbi:MAG: hypothetical protein V1484_02560 [bacterium]
MKKLIHHIRQQPEETRRHILHILVLCFAFILFFLWIYSLGTTLTNTDNQEKIIQGLKPFSALKDNIVSGYTSITKPNLDTAQ